METLARRILYGEINPYTMGKFDLHQLAEQLGRNPLSGNLSKGYLVDRVLSEVFSYADPAKNYPLAVPANVRLANRITYGDHSNDVELRERVLSGELEPLCCQLTVAQLEAVVGLLGLPLPGLSSSEPESLEQLGFVIRNATFGGQFNVTDEELEQAEPQAYESEQSYNSVDENYQIPEEEEIFEFYEYVGENEDPNADISHFLEG
jgi:hypothetical protein